MADKPPRERNLPTGRVQRLARVGRTAAGAAIKGAGTRTVNVARSDEASAKALERRQVETAKQIVKVLGGMKGAAMKLGQVLSFLDVGLVPEEYREEFQAELAKLRDSAPTVSFQKMQKVIEEELGEPVNRAFADFDSEPIAAASIGQVYRARLDDGREVAVKVQYPGVGDAVRADMQNLSIILRLFKRMTPKLDVKSLAEEIRERIVDELDYELEAANHRSLARIYRGHPFITVPPVVTSMSRERIIVTEFVDGDGFTLLEAEPQAERDRIGEIVFRFYFGTMYRFGRFSGDPHPGNMLRLADGRIAFLDFGLFKTLDRESVELELSCQRATIEGNGEELHRLLAANGFLPEPDRLPPDALLDYVLEGVGWYAKEGELKLTPEIVARAALQAGDPRSSHFDAVRHQSINPEHVIGRRLELLTLAVLGELEASNNWHQIAREWIYDDEPVTELGRQETEFLRAKSAA